MNDDFDFVRSLTDLYPTRVVSRALHSPSSHEVKQSFFKYKYDPIGYARNVLKINLTAEQEAILHALPGRVKINSGHNIGKAQPVDLMIETPSGLRRFGDLKVGDYVFGLDGSPTKITAVYPQGTIRQYRVFFDDDSSTLVNDSHLWMVRGRNGRRKDGRKFKPNDGWEVLTTAEIHRRGLWRKNGKTDVRVWELPEPGPVQFPRRVTRLPAYSVGVWLGDGSCSNGRITSADVEMPQMLSEDCGTKTRVLYSKNRTPSILIPGFMNELRICGSLGTVVDQKRVPEEFKYNDVPTRLAILQGLMDTDGTVSKGTVSKGTSTAIFCSTSKGLVEDVIWLVRSLGGKAQMQPTPKKAFYRDEEGNKIHGKLAYQATIRMKKFPLFRLERKQSQLDSREAKLKDRDAVRWIDHMSPEGKADMQCITVDAPDGMYLTNDFIPTHNTFLCACVLSWWYDTRDPCIIITTAPTKRDIEDLLWTEVRLQRARAGLDTPYIGPKAPAIFDHDEHWAKGYTAQTGMTFVGRHRPSMCFLFDESEYIDPPYWSSTNTMYQPHPDADNCWIAIGNPATTTSQSYLEDLAIGPDGKPKWKLFTLSSLDHPNIAAELRGEPHPIPNAVSVSQVNDWIADWCDPVQSDEDRLPSDFVWLGNTYRPGPQFKWRALGLRPIEGVNSIWGALTWERAIRPKTSPQECWEKHCGITIGTDPAEYGDDQTEIHVRTGPLSLHHEFHNGWLPDRTAKRIKELCVEYSGWYNRQATMDRPLLIPGKVRVIIELDGPGVGVISHCDGFGDWSGYKASETSDVLMHNGKKIYYNKRSEVWFETEKKAKRGMIDLSRLHKDVLARLRTQLLAPSYEVDRHSGSLLVEPKDKVKERLKRSPDTADSFLCSHCDTTNYLPTIIGADQERDNVDWRYLRPTG